MDWGERKWSRFCEHHWDVREEMRPATGLYHRTAIKAAIAVVKGERTLKDALAELDSLKYHKFEMRIPGEEG